MERTLETMIEAVLFWKGETVTLPELCRALKAPSGDVKRALKTLAEKLSGRGIALIQAGDDIALATTGETHAVIERLRKVELSRDLGRAALETLSIVLYKGEARRRDVEYIRGVNSATILRSLLIRGLIERAQSATDERVFLYRPTVELLSLLGVRGVEELPEYAAVRAELESAESEQEKTGLPVEDDEVSKAVYD